MDANGQRFWLLAEDRHWHRPGSPARVQWDAERRALRLASVRAPSSPTPYPAEALARLEEVRAARDAFGTTARWSASERAVVATGALPGEVPIATTAGRQTPSDLALGHDGVLYLAVEGAETGEVALLDRRRRREGALVRADGFRPWRIAADPAGGVWVLDRHARRLGHTDGTLVPKRPYGPPAPGTFRPDPENPDPPRLVVFRGMGWPADERAAALAVSPRGRLALLTWAADGTGILRVLSPGSRGFGPPMRLGGAPHPYSLAWTGPARVAVMAPRMPEAPAYDVPEELPAEPVDLLPAGDFYPLREHDGGPFLHGVTVPPHFPTRGGPRPLHRLSLPSFAPRGEAASATLLDAGEARTVWHRLYLEAALPPGCGVILHLAASDDPAAPVDPEEWHEHRFGAALPRERDVPHGSWVPQPSEVPFHPGMLACAPEPGKAGLFTALVQRPGRRVRELRGRYLWVRAELRGTGRATPEVAAVRAYASRFSYRDQYLPELYRESVFGPDADERGRATPADFLERFLATFEGVLTPLEDRVAHAHLLTVPSAAPAEALEWLGGWVGTTLDPGLPVERRRALLAAAPELARRRGTLRGLALALELATGGAVSGGEVVVLEDFRLRRTFATILGADLSDDENPLLGGIADSGNSFVGDTLFLGDENRREFLALFGGSFPLETEDEEEAVRALYDGLAYRATILVHDDVEPQDLGLIRRVAAAEAPAHVQVRVLTATHPFVAGISALVGVDSYLRPRPPREPVRVERSHVGVRDLLLSPVSLDPRLEGGEARFLEPPSPPPVARLSAPAEVEAGDAFELDGTASRAAPGRTIDWYRWTRSR